MGNPTKLTTENVSDFISNQTGNEKIDLSGIEDFDTCGLQSILMFKKEGYTLTNVDEEVLKKIEMFS